MADEIPTFESMFRKSKGLDLAEEVPSEEESTPSEESKATKTEVIEKSAGIREMIARECFEKTGRIPDVDFMDTYEVKKAYSSMDDGDPGDKPERTNSPQKDFEMDDREYFVRTGDFDDAPKDVSKPRVSTPEGLYSALKDMGYSHNFWDHKAHENYKTMANEFLTRHPDPDITDPKYHAYYLDMGLKKRKEAAPNLPTSVPAPAPTPAPVEDYGTRTYDAPDDAIPDYYDGSARPAAPDAQARVAEKNRQAKERAKSSSKGQSQMTLDGAEHQQMVDKISGAKNRAELEAVLNNMGYFRK